MEAHDNWTTNKEVFVDERTNLFSEVLHNLFEISSKHDAEIIDDGLGGIIKVFDDPMCSYRYLASLNLEEDQPQANFDESDTESVANSVVTTNVRHPPFNTASNPVGTSSETSSVSGLSILLDLPTSSSEDDGDGESRRWIRRY